MAYGKVVSIDLTERRGTITAEAGGGSLKFYEGELLGSLRLAHNLVGARVAYMDTAAEAASGETLAKKISLA